MVVVIMIMMVIREGDNAVEITIIMIVTMAMPKMIVV